MDGTKIGIDIRHDVANSIAYLDVDSDMLNSIIGEVDTWSEHSIETVKAPKSVVALNIPPSTKMYNEYFILSWSVNEWMN